MNNKLIVSSSPHIGAKAKTRNIMLDVVIALIPAATLGVIFFGLPALITIAISIISAVIFEYLFNLIASKGKSFKEFGSLKDLSAIVTGLILALNLPATVPFYVPVLGALFAICVVKMLFGGIGKNIANPAIAGRIFLFLSFAALMTKWAVPDAVLGGDFMAGTPLSGATPLGVVKGAYEAPLTGGVSKALEAANIPILDMFLGNIGGCIGETSAAALLVGFIYLVVRKVIDFKGPIIFIATVAIFTFVAAYTTIYAGVEGLASADALKYSLEAVLPSILGGGVFLGAIFMATDYATSPNTTWGNVIFFAGCGLLTVIFRFSTGMTEGVSFAILFMNLIVPLIDKYIVPKPFGYVKPVKPAKNITAQEAK
jgi:electron transport complex protein RnfD